MPLSPLLCRGWGELGENWATLVLPHPKWRLGYGAKSLKKKEIYKERVRHPHPTHMLLKWHLVH